MADTKKRTSLHGSSALERLRQSIYTKYLDEEQQRLLRGFSECVLGGEHELRSATEPVFKKGAHTVWKEADVKNKIKITAAEFLVAAQSLGCTLLGVQRIFSWMDEPKRGAVSARDFANKMRYWIERAQRELPEVAPEEVVAPVRENTGLLARIYNAGKYVESAQVILLAELRQLEEKYAELCASLDEQTEKNEILTGDLEQANVTVTRLLLEAGRMHEVSAELEKARDTERRLEDTLEKERTSYIRKLLEAEQKTGSFERRIPNVSQRDDAPVLERKLNYETLEQVVEFDKALAAETQRRENAEASERKALARLKICEDMLANSVQKEHLLRVTNESLEQSLETTSDILYKQRQQWNTNAGSERRPRLHPIKVEGPKKILRLNGILPRAVCMKAMRYPQEHVAPFSSRLP